ncbi:putative ribonuclease H-like domain-containing protein, partial [Tanacetum coccineum]
NYIPVSLENQTNPHAGTSEVTNSAGTLQTPNANAYEEEDEAKELIVVPTTVRHTASKVGPRKSSTNSKAKEFSWVFFLATKDETSGILQNFFRQIENQLNHRVKIIRSDNGTEFKNRDMLEFCRNKGIKQEYSNARTPQQNGVAERMNRTLIEAARTMLADSLLPTTFWAEAVSTACYIFNRVRVTKPQNKTPYELLFGHKPIISYIRPFGCHVTILDTLSVLGKFDGKCDEGFLVGYSLNSKAFRVYNLVTKKVEVNLHVKFLEEKPNVKGVGYRWMFDIDYLTDSMNYIHVSLENQTNPHAGTSEVTNSAGTLQTPNANAYEEEEEAEELIVVPIIVRHTASKVGPRKSSTNSKAKEELDELAPKHLREVPKNKATSTTSVNSGSGPVNTQHADQDDSDMPELTIFNKPQKGIFDEASYDDEESQIRGDPSHLYILEAVVAEHSGAHALEEPKKISEALKDDSWVEAMQEELLQFRLQQNKARTSGQVTDRKRGMDYDKGFCYCVKNRCYQMKRCMFINFLGFVDPDHLRRESIDTEGVLLDKNFVQKSWCDEFEALMKGRFQMSSMGELIFFLGLQVKQKTDGIFISQDKYVADMLKKFDLASVKTAITPMETKMALTKDEEADEVDVHLYRSMIGSLMYLTTSRPDIMFAVCACSRFQVTPKTSHLNVVKRIFKYLKGKPNLGLWYPRESSFDLEAYSDSDYAGANLDRKSTTGGCQFLGSRLISWQCKKQTIVATSTTEAEYVAAASCCGQVLWIQNQMLDYGFNFMNTKIHIDNESTICIVKNLVYHSKTKHIEIRHHFIRDSYEKKLIRVEKIHTDFNVADLLTKAFDGPRFNFLVVNIVKQFWQTATASTLVDGTLELKATIDTIEYTITKASVQRQTYQAVDQPLPSSSHPPVISATTESEPTPVVEPTPHPKSPLPEPDSEPIKHTFKQPSLKHQPLSPIQETEVPQSQDPTHPHVAEERTMISG